MIAKYNYNKMFLFNIVLFFNVQWLHPGDLLSCQIHTSSILLMCRLKTQLAGQVQTQPVGQICARATPSLWVVAGKVIGYTSDKDMGILE